MPHCKVRELMFAGMTPSVRFSDITDSNQSPICGIFLVNYQLIYDLSRLNFLSDMQSNSAIKINDNSIDILRVKYGGHNPNRCSLRLQRLGPSHLRLYLGVLVCGC